MPKRPEIEESSGNLYADLGFADPALEQAKADLAREIRSAIDIRGMTQVEAGKLLGVDQADVSRITRGRLGGYSLERLITMLSRLNMRVEFRVLPYGGPNLKMSDSGAELAESTDPNSLDADFDRHPQLVGANRPTDARSTPSRAKDSQLESEFSDR